MTYSKLTSTISLALLLTAAPFVAFSAQTPSGENNRVIWNLQDQWNFDGKIKSMVHGLDGKNVYLLNDKNEVVVLTTHGIELGRVPVNKGVTAIDISPKGETLYLIDNNTGTFTSLDIDFVVDIEVTGSPFKGPEDAPVTMTIFTDFECPYCRKLPPLVEKVFENNSENLKIVLKNMPLNFHKMALPAAKAALAAHMQGKFWEFHDKLFAETKLTQEKITKIAQSLELDMKKFEKDSESGAVQQKIQKDLHDAQEAGVTGTPTVFINGRMPRQRSVAGFQALIDSELKKAASQQDKSL